MGRGIGRGGFGGLGDMAKLMKQAQKMQADMAAAQEEMESMRVEATSGGGAVGAVVNGKGMLIGITIKPEACDPEDVEMLQDLVMTAVRDAQARAEEIQGETMKGITGSMGLPPGLM